MTAGLGLFDLTGKRALVTGSSQGIGYALAEGLAAAGAAVVLNGARGRLAEAATALRAVAGAEVQPAFDVTDPRRLPRGGGRVRGGDGPDRHPRQQCRHAAPRAARGLPRRQVGAAHAHQRLHGLQRRPGGGPAHDRARAGKIINIASVQSALARQASPPTPPARARSQPDQGHGDRLGPARPPGQRHRTGLLRHAPERRRWWRTPTSPPGSRNAPPPAAGASCPSSSAPHLPRLGGARASSTATSSTSTAGSPRASSVAPARRSAAPQRRHRQGMERVMGIEPTYSAWKAAALPLSYTRARPL